MPYVPPTTTIVTTTIPPTTFNGIMESGSLSGSINNYTNTGTIQASGTTPLSDPWKEEVSGNMSGGSAFAGYFVGVTGTWKGLVSSIYVTGSGAGYLYGSL